MLADAATGHLRGVGPEVVAALRERTADERFTVTGELLTNTVEVTSGVGENVQSAVDDIAAAIAAVRGVTDPWGIELLCAGSHPFAQWYEQQVSDKTRYHTLIERTQWWGRNMMIWGIHIHIGVEDVAKVMPLIRALAVYLPHLQALSASSPFWAGERTGYASNRSLVFQQLPTAGLPWLLPDWAAFEGYLDDMVRTGVMADATEVRWDIRPAPRWGTIEVRACDGMSTLPELAAVAALAQSLVEDFSRRLDAGERLPELAPWFVRENKWRAARYGLDARVIVEADGSQAPIRDHIAQTLHRLTPTAQALGCARELNGIRDILEAGASYERQLAVADAAGGDLTAVVDHLIRSSAPGLPCGSTWPPHHRESTPGSWRFSQERRLGSKHVLVRRPPGARRGPDAPAGARAARGMHGIRGRPEDRAGARRPRPAGRHRDTEPELDGASAGRDGRGLPDVRLRPHPLERVAGAPLEERALLPRQPRLRRDGLRRRRRLRYPLLRARPRGHRAGSQPRDHRVVQQRLRRATGDHRSVHDGHDAAIARRASRRSDRRPQHDLERRGMAPDEVAVTSSALQTAAASVGAVYFDVGQPLAGHPEWMQADDIHPTTSGQHAIAQTVGGLLGAAGVLPTFTG